MATSSTNAFPARDIERLLASLHGVRSASVVIADHGQIEEIHVLCSPALMPKQVVRNIESALSAGLGIHIDRRIVSVAQLREDVHAAPNRRPPSDASPAAPDVRTTARDSATAAPDAATAQPAAPTAPAPGDAAPAAAPPTDVPPARQTPRAQAPAADGGPVERAGGDSSASPGSGQQPAARPQAAAKDRRFVYVGFDSRTQGGATICRVTVRRGRKQLEGAGDGPNTPAGRARAAAAALFRAVAQADDVAGIGLDGALIVELSGKSFVLVSAQGTIGREPVQLTGIAALTRSPEEAAILAALQAANRWAEPR